MDVPVIASIVAAAASISGIFINWRVQYKIQEKSHAFDRDKQKSMFRSSLDIELTKKEVDVKESEREKSIARLVRMHCLLSYVARDFSFSNFIMYHRNDLSFEDVDKMYLASCREFNELRALVCVYERGFVEEVEKIYGQMNLFWGHLIEMKNLKKNGKEVKHDSFDFQKAHEAVDEIGRLVSNLKEKIPLRVNIYKTGGGVK